jgi:hypothetical protein
MVDTLSEAAREYLEALRSIDSLQLSAPGSKCQGLFEEERPSGAAPAFSCS